MATPPADLVDGKTRKRLGMTDPPDLGHADEATTSGQWLPFPGLSTDGRFHHRYQFSPGGNFDHGISFQLVGVSRMDIEHRPRDYGFLGGIRVGEILRMLGANCSPKATVPSPMLT